MGQNETELKDTNKPQGNLPNPEDGSGNPTKVVAKPYQMVMLCCFSAALGIGYSAQSAYVTPILAQLGVPLRYLTLVWASSPIVGLITQPFIGSKSDGCTSRWGRRRPFILAFAIGILLGLLLVGFGRDIGLAILPNQNTFAIVLVIVGNGILDYGLDASQGPARAYLYDVTPEGQEQRAHIICTILMAIANVIGYTICAIDWDSLFVREDGSVAMTSVQFVFLISSVLSTIAFIICLVSVKDVPLQKSKPEKTKNKPDPVASNNTNGISKEKLDVEVITTEDNRSESKSTSCINSVFGGFIRIPKELWFLVIMNTLSWTGFITYFVIYTDFIGIEVYKGDPTAAINSTAYGLYTVGVKTGSWAFVGYAIVTGVYALSLDFIQNYISKS